MRTVGIIAEYNPFHTGHAYHIRKAKELSGADYAVVVMSPDFVQRGEPAVFDKYTRAQMALLNGADLVLELPVCYACASAEYFAQGAVSLLDRLGAADALCFGAEDPDPAMFRKAARVLSGESGDYACHLRRLLKQGMTWPQARSAALRLCSDGGSGPDTAADASGTDAGGRKSLSDFLSAPNNILGTEYCRALLNCKSRIEPLPVRRKGASYDSLSLSETFCSASALRRGICERAADSALLRFVPENCRDLFCRSLDAAVTPEELLPFLMQKLLPDCSYSSILDISPDLSDRIRSLRFACIGRTYREIVSLLKTRQLTESRIRRALLHLILDIRTADLEAFRADGSVYYARALGFRRDASPLLHRIKNCSSVPLLTKPARASALPDGPAARMWQLDLYASHLYRGILANRTHTAFRTEYEITPLIL